MLPELAVLESHLDGSLVIPEVTGSNGFNVGADMLNENGVLETTLPVSGKYEFWFFPCAMWNNFGRVEICTKP